MRPFVMRSREVELILKFRVEETMSISEIRINPRDIIVSIRRMGPEGVTKKQWKLTISFYTEKNI